jgi:hypothetical protein
MRNNGPERKSARAKSAPHSGVRHLPPTAAGIPRPNSLAIAAEFVLDKTLLMTRSTNSVQHPLTDMVVF